MKPFSPTAEIFAQDNDQEAVSMREAEFAVRDVVISTSFNGLPALIDFLWFVCSKSLRGEGATLTRHLIATEVLRKPRLFEIADYSLVEDAASDVRDRLDHYYANDGQFDQVRIVLSEDSFVPLFKRHHVSDDPLRSTQVTEFANSWLNDKAEAAPQSPAVKAFRTALD